MKEDIKARINIPRDEMFPSNIVSSIVGSQDNEESDRTSGEAVEADAEEDSDVDE